MVGDVGLVGLVEEQLRLHRKLGIEDVYKLLFQGVMGVAHILEDRAGAWKSLKEEFEKVDVDEFSDEPLLERVSVDGSVVRVNLRPFKRLGVSLEGLFEVMVKSAERVRADKEEFVRVWRGFVELVRVGRLDFDYERLREFDAKVKDIDYPPVHHSRRYAEANKPAYRIVEKKVYQEMFV